MTMIFVALSAMGMASALPAPSETCSPNFANNGLSVLAHNSLEWTVGSSSGAGGLVYTMTQDLTSPNFRFEQTGSPDVHYIIKEVSTTSNDLVVSFSNADGSLMVDDIVESKDRQQWNVQCNNCDASRTWATSDDSAGYFAAMGCQIISINSGFCVKASDAAEGLMLVDCDGSDSQNFTFFVTV
ncbi:hypothetical protein BDZ89DRAFT_1087597 [Hymenopellis radicata]|nr:hypothetical protein BDZ89DRAFT_1087597 [Hymenopellis radicata]